MSFFNSINNKTLIALADSVHRKIAHPDMVVKKKDDIGDFSILQKGTLDFVCRRAKSNLNGIVMQTLHTEDKPKIVGLDFIRKKRLLFDIKSRFYSVLYYLSH